MDRILVDAEWCHRTQAHERQWKSVVAKLLGEFETWPVGEDFRLLNTWVGTIDVQKTLAKLVTSETCSIEPEEIRPLLPNGSHLDCDARTTSSKASGKEEGGFQTVGRMVDWCLGLQLSDVEEDVVDAALLEMMGGEQSLNQSLSFIHKCPLFLDIEIKTSLSNRNPEVQLAIWALGALLKRQHHGWDTRMPMPAIAISGHSWEYFLFWATETNELVGVSNPLWLLILI